jgi:hypothetical protein
LLNEKIHIVPALKSQVRELREENSAKLEQINALKKDMRTTNHKELIVFSNQFH